jgi:hypothetical protein
LRQLNEQNINIYDFPLTEDPQVDWMREQLPFAVVGSNTIIQVSAVVGSDTIIQVSAAVGSNTNIQISAVMESNTIPHTGQCCALSYR